MAVVYQHRRNDTNEIFYIGIGKNKHRAGKKTNRNSHWHRIVNKYGFTKEILITNLTWEEAIKEEVRLIKKYGRKDLNKGSLVNQTNGGDGRPSKEFQYDDLPYYTKEQLKSIIMICHPRNN